MTAKEWLQKNCPMMSEADRAWIAPQMELYAATQHCEMCSDEEACEHIRRINDHH